MIEVCKMNEAKDNPKLGKTRSAKATDLKSIKVGDTVYHKDFKGPLIVTQIHKINSNYTKNFGISGIEVKASDGNRYDLWYDTETLRMQKRIGSDIDKLLIPVMNESVSGSLAKALNQTDKKFKYGLIYTLRKNDIDFNRSIGNAEKITANDPRLQVEGNIVIGIFTDANDKTCMTAYQIGTGSITDSTASIDMIRDNSGKIIKLPDFANVSWKKWVSIMTDFYIIEKDKAVPVLPLNNQRAASKRLKVDPNVSVAFTNKVKEIANRYGYEIRLSRHRSVNWLDISLVNTDRSSNVGVIYDNKDGFMINTPGSTWTEAEATKIRDDITKAIDMIHKLNQINIDRVGNIK